ncbi:hypothetical protein [Paenibacillus tyrfis]|nr:hypothetical protein [Paenibacillus tyrfis]
MVWVLPVGRDLEPGRPNRFRLKNFGRKTARQITSRIPAITMT